MAAEAARRVDVEWLSLPEGFDADSAEVVEPSAALGPAAGEVAATGASLPAGGFVEGAGAVRGLKEVVKGSNGSVCGGLLDVDEVLCRSGAT